MGRLLERGADFEILKNGIQIFHMHFEIKYHPSIFQKYRIFNIDKTFKCSEQNGKVLFKD